MAVAVNVRALQAAVAAAVLDPSYQRLLLSSRDDAIRMLPHQPCMPPVRLTAEDREAIFRLPTSSFQALAEGVRQLTLAERRRSRQGETAGAMDVRMALAG